MVESNTSSSSEDEEARRFRSQCASVAAVSNEPPLKPKGSASSREKMLGSDTIARALEHKVDGFLEFVSDDDCLPVEHGNAHGHEKEHAPGMQLFKCGPSITRPATEPIQMTNSETKRVSVLPARRMIDHEDIFSTDGRVNRGVIVQGDALLQHMRTPHPTPKKQKQQGIVVETIRSKAHLRRLKKQQLLLKQEC